MTTSAIVMYLLFMFGWREVQSFFLILTLMFVVVVGLLVHRGIAFFLENGAVVDTVEVEEVEMEQVAGIQVTEELLPRRPVLRIDEPEMSIFAPK